MSILFLQQGATFTATETTPFDDDTTDGAGNALTITAFTNGAGYKMRAPRLEVFHSVDSARDADIGGYDRTELDRYHVKSVRQTRNTELAYDTIRTYAVAKRAGERLSVRFMEFDVSISMGPHRLAAVTTVRTNAQGYEMRYPTWSAALSTDSARDSDLVVSAGTDRDRNRALLSLPVSKAVGWGSVRIMAQTDGRAGNRFGLRWIEVDAEIRYDELIKDAET